LLAQVEVSLAESDNAVGVGSSFSGRSALTVEDEEVVDDVLDLLLYESSANFNFLTATALSALVAVFSDRHSSDLTEDVVLPGSVTLCDDVFWALGSEWTGNSAVPGR